ncbi:MAG: hypothetical protein WED07_16330 [Candidatus Freyarchaeum deiterrae]
MNRTEIVLAAIGIIAIVSLGGVTISYGNTLANQQQNTNLVLYAYFGIPISYGITFYVTNATDPNNTVTTIKKLTWSDLSPLQNTTFASGSTGSPESGPSLNNITYYFFSLDLTTLNLTDSKQLSIQVSGAAGGDNGLGQMVYGGLHWLLGNITSQYPILDYAEGGGGGTATYIGTCKFCAPTGYGGSPNYFAKQYYVKSVFTIAITFNLTA